MAGNILVIGGAGYVGSHFASFAVKAGRRVSILDNFSTGHHSAVGNAEVFSMDLRRPEPIREHLAKHRYDAIFHFAASCLVGESTANPSLYYENNVVAAFNMLEAMRLSGHDRVIFSSTCAVYGIPLELPLKEDHPKNPISPYGRSKLSIEWMLEDYHRAYGLRAACLRYFNAAGCEPEDGLGEDHSPETHLIPNVVRHALGLERKLTIFGKNYPTPDGTCIRDYVHVTDLADAHLRALDKLEKIPVLKLNLGTGKGLSNLEIVKAVAKITGSNPEPQFGPERPGDPPELVADSSAALELLDWRAKKSDIESIVSNVVKWINSHPSGYGD